MNLLSKQDQITKKVNELGFDLVSLTSKKEKRNTLVSLVVDRVEPINMDTIVDLTHLLSDYFDQIDDSGEPYTLDISSLGAEKPLKVEDLHKYKGSYINVHLVNPIDGINIFEGTINEVFDDHFSFSYRIKTRVKNIDIYFKNIYKVRLAIKF